MERQLTLGVNKRHESLLFLLLPFLTTMTEVFQYRISQKTFEMFYLKQPAVQQRPNDQSLQGLTS